MRSLTLAGPLVVATLLAACGSSSNGGSAPVDSSQDEWVQQRTFDRAFAIVKGVDYLPFKYKIDGCYARALYMSMELAAEGMESNEVFAFAPSEAPLVVGDVQWGYHVAPMLEVGTSPSLLVHMVIDPSLSTGPLTESSWLAAMGVDGKKPAPTMLVAPGSDYGPDEAKADDAHRDQDTPNVDQMPPFRVSDVQDACGVMHAYLALEPGSPQPTIEAKQTKLLARTTALVQALTARGKLTADAVFSADACAAYTIAE